MIIGTLLVKNEEEILEQCILHHLNNGIDTFIATDNNSTDNTRKILEKYKFEIIDETGDSYEQGKWVTRMARECCKYNPDWIVNSDADEFWHGLKNLDVFSKNIGVVFLPFHYYDHIPMPNIEFTSITQMPYYEKMSRPVNGNGGVRLVHRPSKNIIVHQGNHNVENVAGERVYLNHDLISMHHYSIRGYKHYEQKIINGGKAYEKYSGSKDDGIHWRNNYNLWKEGKLYKEYEKYLMNEKRYDLLSQGFIGASNVWL